MSEIELYEPQSGGYTFHPANSRVVIGRIRRAGRRFEQSGLVMTQELAPATLAAEKSAEATIKSAASDIKIGLIALGIGGALLAAMIMYYVATRDRK